MSGVYGIRQDELARLCERAPIFYHQGHQSHYLFRSKCHCFLGLDHSDRQDERHVRMLALILPEYLSILIGEAAAGNLGEPAVLKEIKLLRKILATSVCRRALEQLEIKTLALIPWIKLETCTLDTLSAFGSNSSPL